MSPIAAPARIATTRPPAEPSTVLRGEIGLNGVRPKRVPITIAKMSVNAIRTIAMTVAAVPICGKRRIAMKYVISLPM